MGILPYMWSDKMNIYVEVPIWFLLACFLAGMALMGWVDWLIGKLFDEPPKIKVKWEKRI